MNIKPLNVIEPALKDKIRVSVSNLIMASEKLDDLEYWEKRLERLDRDYMIVEYTYTTIDDNYKPVKKIEFGIFSNHELRREDNER